MQQGSEETEMIGSKTVVSAPGAPPAVGPYSPGVKAGDMLFLSGQIPLDPNTGQMVGATVAEQTRQVLKNLESLIDVCQSSLNSVVKTTVYLKSMDDFAEMNKVYGEFFTFDPPARSTVEVSRLPKDALVEIDAIVMLPKIDTGGGSKSF